MLGGNTNYHIEYTENGPAGFRAGKNPGHTGWYCAINAPGEDFKLATQDRSGCAKSRNRCTCETSDESMGYNEYTCYTGHGAVGTRDYDTAKIRKNCDAAAYDQNAGYWKCLDDDFHSNALSASDFAYQTTRAAHATYSGGDQDMWKKKGYFYYDDRDDVFVWSSDDNGEEKYGYAQGEPTKDAYKLWKKSCEKDGCPGFYKVYNECEKGKDGKKTCQQHFYCIKSGTDDLFDDC